MGLKVSFEVSARISFGLSVLIPLLIKITEVLIMIDSLMYSCVWCGLAFLRGHGGINAIQTRD